MSATDWMVIVAGLGLIGWVNWYFFVAPRRVEAARGDRRRGHRTGRGAHRRARRLRAGHGARAGRQAGAPRLRPAGDVGAARRKSSSPTSGSGSSSRPIRPTTIEITPPAPGRYEFTCGMSMLHGAVVAEGEEDPMARSLNVMQQPEPTPAARSRPAGRRRAHDPHPGVGDDVRRLPGARAAHAPEAAGRRRRGREPHDARRHRALPRRTRRRRSSSSTRSATRATAPSCRRPSRTRSTSRSARDEAQARGVRRAASARRS